MKHIRRMSFLILICICIISGCQKKGNSGNPTVTTPLDITILPTYTPTPFISRTPVLESVTMEGFSLLPALSGTYESIWDEYPEIPIEAVVTGKSFMKASYKVIWSEDCIYVQVHVKDDNPDVSAESYLKKDSVVFYLNENGKKNKKYANGDAYYGVDRDGTVYLGTGCDEKRFRAVAYNEKNSKGKVIGYYVEACIPFLTIRANAGTVIGFDVRVNNAERGKLKQSLQWSDTSSHTDVNLRGVGLLTME